MNIKFETTDKVNGQLTIVVEENDYKERVEKTLKDYRRRANIPGFRPGNAPMALVKRQMGDSVKANEINKLLDENFGKYITDNKINMLGMPLASEQVEPADLSKEPPYTFAFDIAVAPEIDLTLTSKDKVDYYTIKVDDRMVDDQVDMYAQRAGHNESAKQYADGDLLKGDLRELDAEGNTKEGGITVEGAMVSPKYIKADDQKQVFDGCKPGDILTFNPKKAYPESAGEVAALLKMKREEAEQVESDFSFQVIEVMHYVKAELNQELFDQVFGKDQVKSEKEFRERIADGLKAQLGRESDFRFMQDVRAYCEQKVGDVTMPDALLKRILKADAKEGTDEQTIADNYEREKKELVWHLIKQKLVSDVKIELTADDLKAAAKDVTRMQFAQYGMSNVPDELVEKYADEMLNNRDQVSRLQNVCIDNKLEQALKSVVKLNEKSVTIDEFNKLDEKK